MDILSAQTSHHLGVYFAFFADEREVEERRKRARTATVPVP